MNRLVMILLMGLLCMGNMSYAANGDLTVGGTLEMTGNANGFLPPRLSTSARGSISPSPGMLIYNTDDNAYNYYTNSGWKILAASLPVHDNTGASSDYALAVGETAYLTFSAVTSVPLHIATVEGQYEVIINATGSTSTSDVTLSPNNATTGSIYEIFNGTLTTNRTTFLLSNGTLYQARLAVTTTNVCKSLIIESVYWNGSPTMASGSARIIWDNAVPWTSLGKLTFPLSSTGKVMIRRIL